MLLRVYLPCVMFDILIMMLSEALHSKMHEDTHYTVGQRKIHMLYDTNIGSITRRTDSGFFTGLAIFFLLVVVVFHFPAEVTAASPTIDEILSITPFKSKDADAVRKGKTISTGLSAVSNREIGVGVACLIKGRLTGRTDHRPTIFLRFPIIERRIRNSGLDTRRRG